MIEGVYAVNLTPFQADGAIDIHAYVEHAAWLAGHGVQGLVPFGTNGEGPSVSLREKLEVLEALFARRLPLQIIPCVTEGNLPACLELVRAVNDLPAAAILLLPPFYFKPAPAEGLRRFFEPILTASRHPVILYHIPKYAVPIPLELVLELPVWGVKDSGGEEGYSEALLSAGRGVLLGTEDNLWQRLALGAQGMISALANIVPEHIVGIHRLFQAGDASEGTRLSAQLQAIRAKTKEYAAPGVLKRVAQARHGIPLGSVRPPLLPPPADYDPAPILRTARIDGWRG